MTKNAIILLVIIVIGGGAGLGARFVRVAPDNAPNFGAIPYEFGEYIGSEERFPEYQYSILKADTTTLRRYTDSSGAVYWLFVAYFESQKYGAQIHSPRHCLPGGGWRIESSAAASRTRADGSACDFNFLTIDRNNEKQVMLYWFETRDGVIRTEFGLKWDLMVSAIQFRPTDAAFVRLTISTLSGDAALARTKGDAFLRALDNSLTTALPFATPR